MENFDDFDDVDFEELEGDILQIKHTLIEIEKISIDNSVKYFKGIITKTFALNVVILTVLCFLIFLTNLSRIVLILPVINFLLSVYFDYDFFKRLSNLTSKNILTSDDLQKLKKIIEISQGVYYLSVVFFVVSIFFIGIVVKLL